MDVALGEAAGAGGEVGSGALPAPLRPGAFALLDISEYWGDTSGGVRTYLSEKAHYVESRATLRQTLVVPGPRDTVAGAAGVRCYHLRCPVIPSQHPYRAMLTPRAVARIVRHERPDIIEVGSSYFAPWMVRGPARREGIPVVWFYHGHLPRIVAPLLDGDPVPRRWVARAAAHYVRAIGRRVARTFVASDFARQDLERFGVENVVRVPLGVDADTFNPLRRSRAAAVRRARGLTDDPIALYTGRFTGEKDLDIAVEAWRHVTTPGATLVLLGAGPRQAALSARAEGLRVRIMPFEHDREAMADLYAAADVYLAPGPAETFGLSAHEAMASGTPVLSVNAGAVAEQVRRCGAGALYPLRDPRALADAADALFASGPDTAGARSRAFIEAHHRWDVVLDRLFGVYREVVAA